MRGNTNIVTSSPATGENKLIAWLRARLEHPLPPEALRSRFAPPLSYGRHFGPPAHDARPAAVMVFLYPRDGQWHLPLTVRPDTMLSHAGQISFPGGMVEAGEATRAAALRELEEELGVPSAKSKYSEPSPPCTCSPAISWSRLGWL